MYRDCNRSGTTYCNHVVYEQTKHLYQAMSIQTLIFFHYCCLVYLTIFSHIPKAKATAIADTPELKRIAENTKIQSNVKYHADFEKQKGKLTQVCVLIQPASDTCDQECVSDFRLPYDNVQGVSFSNMSDKLVLYGPKRPSEDTRLWPIKGSNRAGNRKKRIETLETRHLVWTGRM